MIKVGDYVRVVNPGKFITVNVGDVFQAVLKYYIATCGSFEYRFIEDVNFELDIDTLKIEHINGPKLEIRAGDMVKIVKTYMGSDVKLEDIFTVKTVKILTNKGLETVEDRLDGFLDTDIVVEKYEESVKEEVNMSETFKKFDSEKIDYSLLEPLVVEMYCTVAQMGAKKYGRNNWKQAKADDCYRYEAALLRHIMAYKSGEEIDKESGLSHLSHALWNLVAVETLRRK